MTKPKINAQLVISQGEITMLEMNEGTSADDRIEITDDIGKLIRIRNIVDAAIIDYEKTFQQSFRKHPDKHILWSKNTPEDVKEVFKDINFNQGTGGK